MGFSSPTEAPLRAGGDRVAGGVSVRLAGHRHRCLSRRHDSGQRARHSPRPPPPSAIARRPMLAGTVLVLHRRRTTGLAPGISARRRVSWPRPCWPPSGRPSRRRRVSRRRPWPMPSGIRCGTWSARRAPGDFCCWCCSTRWAMRSRLSLYSAFMIKGVGFSLDELSIAGKVNMTVSTMIGVTFGGWIYMRWGMFRSLLVFGIGQALTNLLYYVAGAVRQETVADGARHHARHRCRRHGSGGVRRVSDVAVQFELQRHSVRAALRAGVAFRAVSRERSPASLVSAIGWPNFFVVTCLTAMPGLILLVILRQPHARTRGARRRAARKLERLGESCGVSVSGAASGRADWTRRFARCPRTRGPDLRPRHRRRPTSPPARPPRR